MKRYITLLLSLVFVMTISAQDNNWFYATMALHDAVELAEELPTECEIIDKKGTEAVVYMTQNAGESLHGRILVHGPGFIYKPTKEAAIADLRSGIPVRPLNRMSFSITEDAWVNYSLDLISTQNIEDQILELEAYGTRYHTYASATQSAIDLKTKWEDMATSFGRADVSVRLYDHISTDMPSVIMTIEGTEFPDEFVIVGGHLDSASNPQSDAPGADDNASGIAAVTEATRALFEAGFVPKRTIEIMAYAAEEIGLVGSSEIAQEYGTNNVDVTAYVNFDMTNYNGSANDIYFITDNTAASLNTFLMDLMNHYNATGPHSFTYGTSVCNYGCSDHASWHNNGYMAAFPFEAGFGQHNPHIHTPGDLFSVSGTAEHAAKFTKLCLEFLIETSKAENPLGITDANKDYYDVWTQDNTLHYILYGDSFDDIAIYDLSGKLVRQVLSPGHSGTIHLDNLMSGLYVVTFDSDTTGEFTQKIIIE